MGYVNHVSAGKPANHFSFLENPFPETATGGEACNFIKKESLLQRCFPVDFAKFLRTPFLQNTSGRLLLPSQHTDNKISQKTEILSCILQALWSKLCS